ncbi:hypothetical protein BH10ACI1_BH10ACI1_11430 [soil metagenome]
MKAFSFRKFFSLLPIFLFLGVSIILGQNTQETKTTETTQTVQKVQPVLVNKPVERYRIGLLDVIDVVIARHPELSLGNIRLDRDGKIRLPRIDTPITAVCKTENELAFEIVELYKQNYLRDPFVSVFVREQNSQPLSVIGAVQKPGSFFTNRNNLTLLELISFAGGPDVEFAGTKVQVARTGGISGCVLEDENVETNENGIVFFTYNLADVVSQKTNPIMRPGDIVYIDRADKIYVTGNVVKPQAITLNQKLTLTQAIAATGGILPTTKKSQVRLIRQNSSGQSSEILIIDLNAIKARTIADPVLEANDIIEVPKDKFKSLASSVFDAFTNGIPSLLYRIP